MTDYASTNNFEAGVLNKELDLLRGTTGLDKPLSGIALSGGGIRSAAFCTGVLQALAQEDVLKDFDYLSSVSGGGYCGTALSWFLHEDNTVMGKQFGTGPKNFPFAESETHGIQGDQFDLLAKKIPKTANVATSNNSTLIDFIRHRASYLQLSRGISGLGLIAKAARSMVISLCVYLCLTLTIFTIFHTSHDWISDKFSKHIQSVPIIGGVYFDGVGSAVSRMSHPKTKQKDGEEKSKPAELADQQHRLIGYGTFTAFGFVFSAASLLFFYLWRAILTGQRDYSKKRTFRQRKETAEVLGKILSAMIAFGLLSAVYILLARNSGRVSGIDVSPITSAFQVFVGLIGAVSARIWTLARNELVSGYWIKSLTWGSGILLILGIISLSILSVPSFVAFLEFTDRPIFAFIVFVAIFLIILLAPNPNAFGLHGLYTNQLSETFLPGAGTALFVENSGEVLSDLPESEQKTIKGTMRALDKKLAGFRSEKSTGGNIKPFHIINTNVVLANSRNRKLAGRGGDSFALTPLMSGSAATGWINTEALDITIASAMAISGAALNPRTMPDAKGSSQDWMLGIIMTLLNLRLGYWVKNPFVRVSEKIKFGGFGRKAVPSFLTPGLTHGLTSKFYHEKGQWLELTDGGHFDNTGLYELIRRRVPNILLVDGSADLEVNFTSFANAFELIRSDFGADIQFRDRETDFNGMFKGSSTREDSISKAYNTAERGFAIGKISYPKRGDEPALEGKIFYIKSVLCDDLRANLYSYHATHSKFPDEPTADQFFNEQQFEVYRMLGEDITNQMLTSINKRYPKSARPYPFGG